MPDYPDNTRLFQLKGTEITIPINIEASDITLPVSIDAATVTIDVNLVASDVTLPVSIDAATVALEVTLTAATATIDINFTDQSVAVWSIEAWVSRLGEQKLWYFTDTLDSGASATAILYTVPTGKVLYVCRAIISGDVKYAVAIDVDSASPRLAYVWLDARRSFDVTFHPPVTLQMGEQLKVPYNNQDTIGGQIAGTLAAFEQDA